MSAFYATNKEVKILSDKLDLLNTKLDLLNTKLDSDAEGNLKVRLSGTIATLYSMNLADRPLYTEITEPTVFVLMNSAMDMWWTDGTADWVVI